MYLRWSSVWQFCTPEQCWTEPPLLCASSWACPAGYSQPTFTPVQPQESTGPTWALLGAERARTATIQSTEHVTVQFKIVEIGEKSYRWSTAYEHKQISPPDAPNKSMEPTPAVQCAQLQPHSIPSRLYWLWKRVSVDETIHKLQL